VVLLAQTAAVGRFVTPAGSQMFLAYWIVAVRPRVRIHHTSCAGLQTHRFGRLGCTFSRRSTLSP
jgi:hypothetical protein